MSLSSTATPIPYESSCFQSWFQYLDLSLPALKASPASCASLPPAPLAGTWILSLYFFFYSPDRTISEQTEYLTFFFPTFHSKGKETWYLKPLWIVKIFFLFLGSPFGILPNSVSNNYLNAHVMKAVITMALHHLYLSICSCPKPPTTPQNC